MNRFYDCIQMRGVKKKIEQSRRAQVHRDRIVVANLINPAGSMVSPVNHAGASASGICSTLACFDDVTA
jgi:hypothetical protein